MSRFWQILGVMVLIGIVLRIAGLFDDFWLDEIWSYYIVKQLHSPLDILLSPAARIDNNHPLNSLFMMLLGEQPNWWVYRLPSLLAGIGSILLAAHIALRRGQVQALLASGLLAMSYPLAFYSTEARGYALAVFFALTAIDALSSCFNKPTWPTALGFGASCVLGFLSHLSFFHIYVGLLAWSACRLLRASKFNAITALIRLHALPLVAGAALHFGFVRHMITGGSPPETMWRALADAICGLVVGPIDDGVAIGVAVAALVGLVALIVSLRRRGNELWLPLLVAAVVSPAIVLTRQAIVQQRWQPISPRYLLVILPLVILAVSDVLAEPVRRRRPIAIALLAAFVGVNLWQTARFIQVGRANHSAAVLYMSQNTPGPIMTVLADDRLRTAMVLNFYARLLPPGQKMLISDPERPAPNGSSPMWIVIHSHEIGVPPPPPSADYQFEREFDYRGLSGYCWYLYSRKR